jgi:hypothetical protein
VSCLHHPVEAWSIEVAHLLLFFPELSFVVGRLWSATASDLTPRIDVDAAVLDAMKKAAIVFGSTSL